MDSSSETIRQHHVTIRGKGQTTLMFAHGFGCDQTMWRYVAPAFEERYRVITFDHIGAGQSDSSAYDRDRHSNLHGYADDVIRLIEDTGSQPVVFVGHSVSAMIGGLASIRRPDLFAQLFMIGPSPRYLDDVDYHGGFSQKSMDDLFDLLEANYLEWPRQMAPAIVGNPDRPMLAEDWSTIFCRNDPEIAKRFARVTFLSDNRAELARITTPTVILQCAEDVIAGEWVGHYMQKSIAGSRLIKLNATGHCPNLSHPDEVIAVLKTCLLPDMMLVANAS